MYFRSHISKVEYSKHDSIGSNPWSKTLWHLMCHVSLWLHPCTTGFIKNLFFFLLITRATTFWVHSSSNEKHTFPIWYQPSILSTHNFNVVFFIQTSPVFDKSMNPLNNLFFIFYKVRFARLRLATKKHCFVILISFPNQHTFKWALIGCGAKKFVLHFKEITITHI